MSLARDLRGAVSGWRRGLWGIVCTFVSVVADITVYSSLVSWITSVEDVAAILAEL